MTDTTEGFAAPETHRFEFSGTGREYFRIWIVNLALSIVTLGIYSAWAKVRRVKYFYGNTTLAGHAFDYHGRPIAILKGRLIGVTLLAVYVGAGRFAPRLGIIVGLALWMAVPWIITRARMFQLRVTSYRGVHFDFEPDYRGAFRAFILAPLGSAFSLGIALPWATRIKNRWLVENSAYGKTYFELDIGLKPYVRALLMVAPVVIVGWIVIGVGSVGAATVVTHLLGIQPGTKVTPPQAAKVGLYMMVMIYPLILLLMYAVLGLWRALTLGPTLSSTTLGPVRLHCTLPAGRLMWIYVSNLIAIVFTIGLYAPWARVRLTKFLLESASYETTGPIDGFVGAEAARTSAVGEEVGGLFDIDFGL